MLQAGTNVKALPYGSQEILTPEEELEFDPYEGPTTPVQGILEIIEVPADYDFNSPAYTLYIVDNQSVDPDTIEKLETKTYDQIVAAREATMRHDRLLIWKAALEEFYNQNHDEKGRFAPKEGGQGGLKSSPAEVRKWAKENNLKVGERGRIHPDIQDKYNKAHTEKTPANQGDFKTRYAEASKGLSEDVKALAVVEYPKGQGTGPRYKPVIEPSAEQRAKVEQRVNKVGGIIHDEITTRLEKQGFYTQEGALQAKDQLWSQRKQYVDVIDKLRADAKTAKDPKGISAIEHAKELYPGKDYKSLTPQERSHIQSVIDQKYPGYKDASQHMLEIDKQFDSIRGEDTNYQSEYRKTALQVLEEIRPFGGLSFDRVLGSPEGPNTSKAVIDSVKRAGHVYPDEWVADSNQGYVYTMTKKRGLHEFRPNSVSYSHTNKGPDGKPTKTFQQNSYVSTSQDPSANLEIDKSQYYPTSVHEMGHRMEELRPHIKVIESAFFARRTKGETPQPLKKLQPNNRYEADEYASPDKFENAYMGKTYGGGPSDPYELFTMGMQGMFGGSRQMHIHKDRDYASFILGVLATG